MMRFFYTYRGLGYPPAGCTWFCPARRRMGLSLAHVSRGSPSSFVNNLTSNLLLQVLSRLSSRKEPAPRRPGSIRGSVRSRQCSTCASSIRHVFHVHPSVQFITSSFAAPVVLMFLPCCFQYSPSHAHYSNLVPMHPTSRKVVRSSSVSCHSCRHKSRPLT
jgi:hypothetical protein